MRRPQSAQAAQAVLRNFLADHPPLLSAAASALDRAEYGVSLRGCGDASKNVARAIRGYPRFLRERQAYQLLSREPLARHEDNPQLLDWTETSPYDPHYTHQDAWAAREIFKRRPRRHVDVGSRITYAIGVAAFVPVTFIDLRPLEIAIPGLDSKRGSVVDLPYEDEALESLSCLHVAEHVGLGRYGDHLDPDGTGKAALELERVLAPGGFHLGSRWNCCARLSMHIVFSIPFRWSAFFLAWNSTASPGWTMQVSSIPLLIRGPWRTQSGPAASIALRGASSTPTERQRCWQSPSFLLRKRLTTKPSDSRFRYLGDGDDKIVDEGDVVP